jgi:putative phosphoesterase
VKIGIISDIHGYPNQFRKAMKHFAGCDMILCGGDLLYHGPRNPILEGYKPQELAEEINKNEIPMLIAKGNCDSEVDLMVLGLPIISPVIVYEKENIRFVVLHGHDKDEGELRDIARIYKVDILITGHTHIKSCEAYLDTLFINPGSVSVPKDGTASIAIFENNEIKFINIESGEIISKCYF